MDIKLRNVDKNTAAQALSATLGILKDRPDLKIGMREGIGVAWLSTGDEAYIYKTKTAVVCYYTKAPQ